MFMYEIQHLFRFSPLTSMAKVVFLDCLWLKNYSGSQGIVLHIPNVEHLLHRYAKNKKIQLWRFLQHPDLKHFSSKYCVDLKIYFHIITRMAYLL